MLIYTRKMILTGYLLLTCKLKQVVRRESKWTKGQMPLNTLHLRLRDIHVGKEGQKSNLITDTLLLLSQVNPLAESVDTDDDKCLSIYLCISSVYSQVPFNIS